MKKKEEIRQAIIKTNTKSKKEVERGILNFLNEASSKPGKTSKPG